MTLVPLGGTGLREAPTRGMPAGCAGCGSRFRAARRGEVGEPARVGFALGAGLVGLVLGLVTLGAGFAAAACGGSACGDEFGGGSGGGDEPERTGRRLLRRCGLVRG